MRENASFAAGARVGYLSHDSRTWFTQGGIGYTDDGKPVYGPRGQFVGMGRVTYDNEGKAYYDELGGSYRRAGDSSYEDELGSFGKRRVGDMWDWLLGSYAEREAKYQGATPLPFTAEVVSRVRAATATLSAVQNRVELYAEPWRSQAQKKLEELLLTNKEGDYPYHWKYWYQKGEWNTYAEKTLQHSEANLKYMTEQYLPTTDRMIREMSGATLAQQQTAANQTTQLINKKPETQAVVQSRAGQMGFLEANWPVLAGGAAVLLLGGLAISKLV